VLGLYWLKPFRVQCYLASRLEVEGFRDQGFVLPKVENPRVKNFVVSKASPSREEPDITLSITNSRHAFRLTLACFYTHTLHAYYWPKAR